MEALIVLAMYLPHWVLSFFNIAETKISKKLLIALITFGVIISLAVVGNLTRQVMPIYLAHIMLTVVSWGGLIVYLVSDKYYGWIIFSPMMTIGLFLLLEFLGEIG